MGYRSRLVGHRPEGEQCAVCRTDWRKRRTNAAY